MCTAMNAVAVIDSARCRRSTAARGNAVDAARPAVAMPRTTTAVNSTRETTPTARLEYQRTVAFIADQRPTGLRPAGGVRSASSGTAGRGLGACAGGGLRRLSRRRQHLRRRGGGSSAGGGGGGGGRRRRGRGSGGSLVGRRSGGRGRGGGNRRGAGYRGRRSSGCRRRGAGAIGGSVRTGR